MQRVVALCLLGLVSLATSQQQQLFVLPLDEDGAPVINLNPGTRMPLVPPSPYVNRTQVCLTSTTPDLPTAPLFVRNRVRPIVASPFVWDNLVFSRAFKDPPRAQPKTSFCYRPDACIDSFEMEMVEAQLDLGCPLLGALTPMLTYNGTFPGPTFWIKAGRQSLIRVTNNLKNGSISFPDAAPCSGDGVDFKGRPATMHHHGAPTSAPYDGWAEDITCPGYTKDYVFPNEAAAFRWYHDHTIHITTEQTYYGLSGMHIIEKSEGCERDVEDRQFDRKDTVYREGRKMLKETQDRFRNFGNCGIPWNMAGIQEFVLHLSDRTFNADCSTYFQRQDNFLFGDVNYVSGTPWPVITMDAAWTRIRMLAGADERAFMPRIVDAFGNDVSSKKCKVIASDGGIGRFPTNIPPTGIFMMTGERYEIVCDFEGMENETMYLWNEYDPFRMIPEVLFCYSHLLARIEINAATPVDPVKFIFDKIQGTVIDKTINETEFQIVQGMVDTNTCTRTFNFTADFSRGRPVWLINGETWDSMRIQAEDIGQHTWEVWCLNTQPGFKHAIHIHQVQMYILSRGGSRDKVEPYEVMVPKDVIQLYPGESTAVLMRFGPQKGEYMFHCHVTIHEDEVMMGSFLVNNTAEGLNFPQGALANYELLEAENERHSGLFDPLARGAVPTALALPLDVAAQNKLLVERPYSLIYPLIQLGDTPQLNNPFFNPWRFSCSSPEFESIEDALGPYAYAATHSSWGINKNAGNGSATVLSNIMTPVNITTP